MLQKMNTILLLGVFLVIVTNVCVSKNASVINDENLDKEWKLFKDTYNKSYKNNDDEELRKKIFENNFKMIENHNKNYTSGTVTFGMGMNQFGDLTHDEFLNRFSYKESKEGTINLDVSNEAHFDDDSTPVSAPTFCKWDKPEEVNDVKDQGDCRSGWAYSTADAMAGRYFVFNKCNKTIPILSAKYLIDCSEGVGNHKCNSGEAKKACTLVLNKGMPYEKSYKNECKLDNETRSPIKIKHCKEKNFTSKEMLKQSICKHGPVSGSISVEHPSFQFAREGVYSEENCDKMHNHDVLVVGYGTEKGFDYWLVKNSFGTSWGDKGFLKISVKESKTGCEILKKYMYPEFTLKGQMDFHVDKSCICG